MVIKPAKVKTESKLDIVQVLSEVLSWPLAVKNVPAINHL